MNFIMLASTYTDCFRFLLFCDSIKFVLTQYDQAKQERTVGLKQPPNIQTCKHNNIKARLCFFVSSTIFIQTHLHFLKMFCAVSTVLMV